MLRRRPEQRCRKDGPLPLPLYFERRLGIDVFRPLRKNEIPIDPVQSYVDEPFLRPLSVQYAVIPTVSDSGGSVHACHHASPMETCERFGAGTLLGGRVNAVAIQEHPVWDTLRLEFYLHHELLRVLGVGHACWASSVMSLCRDNAVVGYRQEFSDKVTSLDPGYLQLYVALHEKLLDVPTWAATRPSTGSGRFCWKRSRWRERGGTAPVGQAGRRSSRESRDGRPIGPGVFTPGWALQARPRASFIQQGGPG